MDLIETGEVSPTIGIPTWPFVFSLTVGCGLLSFVLLLDALRQMKRGLAP
jgi:TRAP-type C4-dicarboxylate transport system permease small subunit